MDLLNATKMIAGYTMGMKPDGRELLVVAVKGTFNIPHNGENPSLVDEQVPLIEADIFTGEPGFSAPVYETDYAPYKPRCDVLLNGSAYAPGGKPTKKVTVMLKVGSIKKSFNVIGNRVWEKTLGIFVAATPIKPFTVMPITYDNAFGGTDNTHKDPAKHRAIMENPIGVGFHTNLNADVINGKPLPNTEEIGKKVSKPKGRYHPMSFGPTGRGWKPRYKLAGTYDQNWLDNVFPFLPADFNEAYYQSAPMDQQMEYIRGSEIVELFNLSPQGHIRFSIPKIDVPIVFFLKKGGREEAKAIADTLVLEPDNKRFIITWRASLPLKRNIFEVAQVLVGEKPRSWWLAREIGKTYYSSLKELIQANRLEKLEELE